MKISKLFHWLFCVLMFLPFFFITSLEDISGFIFSNSGVGSTIKSVFDYLFNDLFGVSGQLVNTISSLMSYWLIVAIAWLIFDLIMYVPNLAHKWVDNGSIE